MQLQVTMIWAADLTPDRRRCVMAITVARMFLERSVRAGMTVREAALTDVNRSGSGGASHTPPKGHEITGQIVCYRQLAFTVPGRYNDRTVWW
jgi:hypothetical protein